MARLEELSPSARVRGVLPRELAYQLYTLCERRKRAPKALAYSGLVQSWPEIQRLAAETPSFAQETML